MGWLSKVQHKSREEKIRIIWTVSIVAAVILVILWIFTSKIGSVMPKDTSLFKSMGQGLKDVRDNYKK